MSFLKDKEWDKMDWLNRAVEPFTFSFNVEFAKLPSEHTISYMDVMVALKSNREIRMSDVVTGLARQHGIGKTDISMMETIGLEKLFDFRLEPDTEIDLDKETIRGSLTLVKTVESMNDDMIRELLPQMVHQILRINSSRSEAAHLNEAMDILECKEARGSSSTRKKAAGLTNHIHNIYKENTWNLRNVDLAMKMLGWIKSYCENGDRCSLANMSKLKCMIHNGHPIYSMEEIK